MTHINLDVQSDNIRQFVLGLSASPDGAVLESGGQAVACLVPPSKRNAGAGDSWTDEMNQRRCELIDRKYASGLSASEAAELAVLQDGLYRYLDRVAPLPLAAARRLEEELLQKARGSEERRE